MSETRVERQACGPKKLGLVLFCSSPLLGVLFCSVVPLETVTVALLGWGGLVVCGCVGVCGCVLLWFK